MPTTYSDCTNLIDLSLDSIVDNVLGRYQEGHKNNEEDSIYTWIGHLLLALNPLQKISSLYSNEVKQQFYQKKIQRERPHVFAVAQHLLTSVSLSREEQRIVATAILSGESGAGKTESAKLLISYLTWASRQVREKQSTFRHLGTEDLIEDRLVEGSMILEAFGNARTINNINSSRFGRLSRIMVSNISPGHSIIKEASISTYLLAKNRIAHLLDNEQNFHVFYSFLEAEHECKPRGIDPHMKWKLLGLHDVDAVVYFPFARLRTSMRKCGFSSMTIDRIWDILSSLFQLAEVVFLEDERGHAKLDPDTSRYLVTVARTWDIQFSELRKILLGMSIIDQYKPFEIIEAERTRDSLLQYAYSKLFSFVVSQINSSLGHSENDLADFSASVDHQERRIQILDIYGFENEPKNSLEQLCINYVNERLQSVFLNNLILDEVRLYQQEGIQITMGLAAWQLQRQLNPSMCSFDMNAVLIKYKDELGNKARERLDGLDFIFNELHDATFAPIEEVRRDTYLVQQIHRRLPQSKPRIASPLTFSFSHFAGVLMYTAADFCVSNRDDLHADAMCLLKRAALLQNTIESAKAVKMTRYKSMGLRFVGLVKDLTETLEKSQTTMFIRCLRLNTSQTPNEIDRDHVRLQLQYGGIQQITTAVKSGFPLRKSFHDLRDVILKSTPSASSLQRFSEEVSVRRFVQTILIHLNLSKTDYKVGIQKVFFRSETYDSFLKALDESSTQIDETDLRKVYHHEAVRGKLRQVFWALCFCAQLRLMVTRTRAAIVLQKHSRGWLVRYQIRRRLQAVGKIQRWWRRRQLLTAFEPTERTPETMDGGDSSNMVESPAMPADSSYPTWSQFKANEDISGHSSKESTLDHFKEGTLDNLKEGTLDNFKESTLDNLKEGTLDNFKESTLDNLKEGTLDNFKESTLDNFKEVPEVDNDKWIDTHVHRKKIHSRPAKSVETFKKSQLYRQHNFERKIARDRILLNQIAKLRDGLREREERAISVTPQNRSSYTANHMLDQCATLEWYEQQYLNAYYEYWPYLPFMEDQQCNGIPQTELPQLDASHYLYPTDCTWSMVPRGNVNLREPSNSNRHRRGRDVMPAYAPLERK